MPLKFLINQIHEFLLEPHGFWSSVMRGRYGGLTPDAGFRPPRGCSFIWKAICQFAPSVMPDIHCMIGDGSTINVIHDAWIADLSLDRWPTFLSSDIGPSLLVSALICQDAPAWHRPTVSRLFGAELVHRILAIPLASSATADIRLWRQSCLPRVPIRDLVDRICPRDVGLDNVAWIWRLPIHPRIQLFLWKLKWDRLPTCSLLAGRGLSISPYCPICGTQEETVEHAILKCHRASQIWQQLRFSPWMHDEGPTLVSFLRAIRTAVYSGNRFQGVLSAYLAYHIWLTRNQSVFADDMTPSQIIIRRAGILASEYLRYRLGSHSDRPGFWGSPAISAAHRSTVFISWEPPPPGYVKVNFDGSVSGRTAGSGFVIRGPDGQLLAAGGHGSLDIAVPMAELQAAWAGTIYAVRILHSNRIVIEGDSLTVIRWIRQDGDSWPSNNPLITDIWASLQLTYAPLIRHVYREANAAADWVASAVARHSGQWEWHSGDPCPVLLEQIMYSDASDLTHPRVV